MKASALIPTVIPYQGSKRRLAPQILQYIPGSVRGTFFEPFAGSAALSLAVARSGNASKIVISDVLEPLVGIWKLLLEEPETLAASYQHLWERQQGDPRGVYDAIRAEFNSTQDPNKLLYLIARCVKNSIRFNPNGHFNQSPDNRRLGMRPAKMRREIIAAHQLLFGKALALRCDYSEILNQATQSDFIYMDPPYQGVSYGRDRRYFKSLDLESFVDALACLNDRGVSYIVSFDGRCGQQEYGEELPQHLELKRISLHAGRSSQATLLGRNEVTVESIYLSPGLQNQLELECVPQNGDDDDAQLTFPAEWES